MLAPITITIDRPGHDERTLHRYVDEALAGQVYRVHYLQEQVERQQQTIEDLQSRLKEAFAQISAVKVTPIAQAKSRQLSDVIQEELKSLRIRLTESLNRVIRSHNEETVLLAIKAFRHYKETHEINNLAGCLRRAIEEGWVPNEASTPSTPEQDEFDQFYADAVACGFLLDIPKNYLPVQGGEFVVKLIELQFMVLGHLCFGDRLKLNTRSSS